MRRSRQTDLASKRPICHTAPPPNPPHPTRPPPSTQRSLKCDPLHFDTLSRTPGTHDEQLGESNNEASARRPLTAITVPITAGRRGGAADVQQFASKMLRAVSRYRLQRRDGKAARAEHRVAHVLRKLCVSDASLARTWHGM